ncbi:ribbon-helix-helix protein, CopG family [Burkholderia pseudomallei]|uniref:ribbon-helix-helix protein, CopG family n=1 Tax=Burkholderia pseudomallei TaxID=28450 RepID=UPI001F51A41D|nr:ribbon-helix-helix protein, CopG family [Burkholderia pseudomallei]
MVGDEAAITAFISGAPDARHAEQRVTPVPGEHSPRRRAKVKISVDIDPDLLERVDKAARASGISRNAVLALGAGRVVEEFDTGRGHKS